MEIDRIRELAIELISEIAANTTKENAFSDMEYVRGITDLLAEIQAIPESREVADEEK